MSNPHTLYIVVTEDLPAHILPKLAEQCDVQLGESVHGKLRVTGSHEEVTRFQKLYYNTPVTRAVDFSSALPMDAKRKLASLCGVAYNPRAAIENGAEVITGPVEAVELFASAAQDAQMLAALLSAT